MGHSIIIIDECINALKGDATWGALVDLQENVVAVDALLATRTDAETEEAMHEALERVQAVMCEGATAPNGFAAEVEEMNDELEEFL